MVYTPSGCKNIRIGQIECVAKIQLIFRKYRRILKDRNHEWKLASYSTISWTFSTTRYPRLHVDRPYWNNLRELSFCRKIKFSNP